MQQLRAEEQKPPLSHACDFGHASPHSDSILRLWKPLLRHCKVPSRHGCLFSDILTSWEWVKVWYAVYQNGVSYSYHALSLVSRRVSANPGWLFHPGIAPWISVGGFCFPCPSQAVICEVHKPLFALSGWRAGLRGSALPVDGIDHGM